IYLPLNLKWLYIGTKFGLTKNILKDFKNNTLCKFKKIAIFGDLDWDIDMENQRFEYDGIYEELYVDDIRNSLIPNYGIIFSI
ncbi:4647_t:CDS:1, partial [Scutellospora calospora]